MRGQGRLVMTVRLNTAPMVSCACGSDAVAVSFRQQQLTRYSGITAYCGANVDLYTVRRRGERGPHVVACMGAAGGLLNTGRVELAPGPGFCPPPPLVCRANVTRCCNRCWTHPAS